MLDAAAGTVTVQACKYSTYAIVYGVKSIPKTGDDMNLSLYNKNVLSEQEKCCILCM